MDNDFPNDFFRKIFVKIFVVCKGLKTAKKVVIVHSHYNFFSQLQQFFQQFYIWTKIFPKIFLEKSL